MKTNPVEHDPWLHRLAILVTAATFPLIFMGGLVTTKGAGMSVPDWPNSYGYNMFLFPPSAWVGGIWYEHVHRLAGSFVGFCALSLMIYAWGPARTSTGRRIIGWAALTFGGTAFAAGGAVAMKKMAGTYEGDLARYMPHWIVGFASLAFIAVVAWLCRRQENRRWVRWLTFAAFAAVCLQGVLGGMRVRAVNLDLAIVHACFAQAFLCVAVATAVVTSRNWKQAAPFRVDRQQQQGWKLTKMAVLCVALIYCQLVVGAFMRHYKAGLAIPTLPLAFGHVLPPTDEAGLRAANQVSAFDYHQPPATLPGMWLHFAHRGGAAVVSCAVIFLFISVRLSSSSPTIIRQVAWLMLALVGAQVTLGVLTVYWLKPADIASLHVACGALLLMTAFVMTCLLARVNAPYFRTAAARSAGFEPVVASQWATS